MSAEEALLRLLAELVQQQVTAITESLAIVHYALGGPPLLRDGGGRRDGPDDRQTLEMRQRGVHLQGLLLRVRVLLRVVLRGRRGSRLHRRRGGLPARGTGDDLAGRLRARRGRRIDRVLVILDREVVLQIGLAQ